MYSAVFALALGIASHAADFKRPLASVGTGLAPVVDGRLTDPGWTNCAQLFPFCEAGGAGLAKTQTRAFVFYDAANLYIGFRCEEPNPKKMVAQYHDRDTGVWRDDCVEIFLARPGAAGPDHLIVNSRGTLYDDRNGDVHWDMTGTVAVQVRSNAWTVECALPWTDLGGRPKPGAVWRANFCRERKVQSELSNWSCTYGNFGKPNRFGQLVFSDAPVRVERLELAPPVPGANSATLDLRLPPGPTAVLLVQNEKVADIHPGSGPIRIFYPLGLQGQEIVLEAQRGNAVLWRSVIPYTLEPKPALPDLDRALAAFTAAAARLPKTAPVRSALAAAAAPAKNAGHALNSAISASLKQRKPLAQATYKSLNTAVAETVRDLSAKLWPVWTRNNWLDVDRREPPTAVEDIATCEFRTLVNDVQSKSFIISNLRDTPLRLRAVASDLTWQVPIPPGARNYLRNPGFEQDENKDGVPDGWIPASGNRKCWRRGSLPGHGKVLVVDRTTAHGLFTIRQNVSLEAGKRYIIQFRAKTEGPTPGVRVILINKGWHRAPGTPLLAGDRDWHTVRATITAPPNPPHQLVIWGVPTGSGKVYLDDFRLVDDDGRTVTFGDSAPRLRVADWQALRGGGTRADPLLPLNVGGRLDIPPGGNRQVWLTFPAQDLPPGRYTGSLELRPLASVATPAPAGKHVNFDIERVPFRLRTSPEFRVYNWDYAKNEAQVRDLFEHKVNVFLSGTGLPLPLFRKDGTPAGPMDFSSTDRMLRIKMRYARQAHGEILFSYGIIRDFHSVVSKRYGWKFMDPAWTHAFTHAYTQWLAHLRKLGLRYDEFSVQIWDEATGGNVKYVVDGGKLLRRLDPEVRLVMDGAQSVAEARRMAPYVDVWIPHLSHLRNGADHENVLAWYKAAQKAGKPVWTYTCRTNMKAQPPYEYHRLKPWYAAKLGLDGVCYWAYNSWRGDPWNDFDGSIADCGVIYPGADEPIDSRRWEASREGIEDWQLLRLVRRLAQEVGDAGTRQKALARIDAAIRTVLAAPTEPDRAKTERRQLIELALGLTGKDPLHVEQPTVRRTVDTRTVHCRTNRPTTGTAWIRTDAASEWRRVALPRGREHRLTLSGSAKPAGSQWFMVLWDDIGRVAVAEPSRPKTP